MKNLHLALLMLFFSSCIKTINASDEDAVKQVVLDFQEDFNDGTFKKAEVYATEDWVHINPGGGIKVGKVNVFEEVRSVHQTFLKGVAMTTDSINVRFLTPEVAIAIASHPIDRYTTPDNVTHENERQIKSYVMVKRGGRWLLALDQNTIMQTRQNAHE